MDYWIELRASCFKNRKSPCFPAIAMNAIYQSWDNAAAPHIPGPSLQIHTIQVESFSLEFSHFAPSILETVDKKIVQL